MPKFLLYLLLNMVIARPISNQMSIAIPARNALVSEGAKNAYTGAAIANSNTKNPAILTSILCYYYVKILLSLLDNFLLNRDLVYTAAIECEEVLKGVE